MVVMTNPKVGHDTERSRIVRWAIAKATRNSVSVDQEKRNRILEFRHQFIDLAGTEEDLWEETVSTNKEDRKIILSALSDAIGSVPPCDDRDQLRLAVEHLFYGGGWECNVVTKVKRSVMFDDILPRYLCAMFGPDPRY